jgi:preprotein translocase subunit SecD
MSKFKKIFLNFRVIVLIIALVLAFVAISPNPWNEGVVIKGVTSNSSASAAGIEVSQKGSPMGREMILAINGRPISSLSDYQAAVEGVTPNSSVTVKTSEGTYTLLARPLVKETVLNETELVTINETVEVNGTNQTVQKQIEQPKVLRETIGVEPLGFVVDTAPQNNLKKGLDLQGGTRVVLAPETTVPQETLDLVVDSLTERLNVYGLSDVVVRQVSDRPGFLGEGNRFVVVEIAGASEEEVTDLLSNQGKFEARIANQTVFSGGNDVTYVCKTAQCSGLDPNRGCGTIEGGWACSFMFSITLDPAAAQRQADATRQLSVVGESLSEPLVLYLDDQEVDSLSIAASLRGRAVTDIAITGGGEGLSQQAAVEDTLNNMKRLQTILITGSLPVKLDIVRVDHISPTLGKEFLKNALWVGLLSIVGVVALLLLVYRKIQVAIPILLTALFEIFITFGIAALVGQNIDLAYIAGIVLAIGTGVNDQIIITDEALSGKAADVSRSWKEKMKRAFGIIFSAFFTTTFAMGALLFVGAGLLKGFAIATILTLVCGVFITRPAFGAIVGVLLEK